MHESAGGITDTCAPEGASASGSFPSLLFVNNDDDNGNGIEDYKDRDQMEQVDNELKGVTLSASWSHVFSYCNLPDTSSYAAEIFGAAGGALDFFTDNDMTGHPLSERPQPQSFYVGARAATGACPANVLLGVLCGSTAHDCVSESKTVLAVKVGALTWERAHPSNAELDECPNNGGKRIFPGLLDPTDGPNEALRRQVKLVATVVPPIEGVDVYFSVFDVDDPFDQVHGPGGAGTPIADVQILDSTPTTGDDNRGTTTGLGFHGPVPTGPDGKAEITLTVSMQPGDNYRAAASVIREAVETQINQASADTLGTWLDYDGEIAPNGGFGAYQVPAVWSQMLTVWRKLHLEVDSMDRESEILDDRFPYYFEQDRCVVTSVIPDQPAPGFTTVQCGPDPDPLRAGFAGTNFFEGGAFWCTHEEPETMIVRSELGPDSYTLILWGAPEPNITGQTCFVRDDDPYYGSASGQLPVFSVLNQDIEDAYRDAYVSIVEESSWNLVNLVPWQSHLAADQLTAQYYGLSGICSQWDLSSSDAFWVRHLVVCYQAARTEAGDGDIEENCGISHNCALPDQPYPLPVQPGLTALPLAMGRTIRLETFFDTATSTVYVETIRDQIATSTVAPSADPVQWQVVAHEIGHATLDHSYDEAGQDAEHTEGGLMTSGDFLRNIPADHKFSAPSLLRFRDVTRW